jgi:hypothetical protein
VPPAPSAAAGVVAPPPPLLLCPGRPNSCSGGLWPRPTAPSPTTCQIQPTAHSRCSSPRPVWHPARLASRPASRLNPRHVSALPPQLLLAAVLHVQPLNGRLSHLAFGYFIKLAVAIQGLMVYSTCGLPERSLASLKE